MTRGLDHLISNLARDLKDEMEEKEGDVWIERRGRGGFGWVDEREEVGEEGGPFVDVGAEEEECEGVRELVAEDCVRCGQVMRS